MTTKTIEEQFEDWWKTSTLSLAGGTVGDSLKHAARTAWLAAKPVRYKADDCLVVNMQYRITPERVLDYTFFLDGEEMVSMEDKDVCQIIAIKSEEMIRAIFEGKPREHRR